MCNYELLDVVLEDVEPDDILYLVKDEFLPDMIELETLVHADNTERLRIGLKNQSGLHVGDVYVGALSSSTTEVRAFARCVDRVDESVARLAMAILNWLDFTVAWVKGPPEEEKVFFGYEKLPVGTYEEQWSEGVLRLCGTDAFIVPAGVLTYILFDDVCREVIQECVIEADARAVYECLVDKKQEHSGFGEVVLFDDLLLREQINDTKALYSFLVFDPGIGWWPQPQVIAKIRLCQNRPGECLARLYINPYKIAVTGEREAQWEKQIVRLWRELIVDAPLTRAEARAIQDTDASTDNVDLPKLRQILAERFSESELRDLCFDLGVQYDTLPGEGTGDKARELLSHCQRHERILELIERGKQLRPDIVWSEVYE